MTKKAREISLGFTDAIFREGLHIVYLYNDDFEKKKTMGKFLKQGWLENEKLLYLVDDISHEEILHELLELGLDAHDMQNDFDITQGHYACCPNHCFSGDFMLGIVQDYYQRALDDGYSGARGVGEMSWALREDRSTIPELLEYEARLNSILQDYPLTTVCQYDVRKFDGALIMDLLSVHPMMIVRGQLVKNPTYIEPDDFLREYHDRLNRQEDHKA